MKEMSAPTARL